ncbi:MAG: O-antigen ligase family protein, partial [Clostridiales bacterium]|nr:O-antigen ligase family protein [Clostridiales bacterium]
STFSDPNAFAAFLAIAGPLLLGASFHFKGWRRVFFGAAFAGTLFVFPFTGVRSALLGLGVAILVFLWLTLRARSSTEREAGRRRRRTAIWVGVSLIVLIIIVLGALSFRNARVVQRIRKNWQDFQANKRLVVLSPERFFLWKAAVEMGRDYPASGVGVGAYIIELPNTYTEDERDYPFGLEAFRRNDSAENYFLHVFAELGFPGLLLFLWIFWLVLKEIRSGLRRISAQEGSHFMIFGAVAGVFSYFINILFHSYIGSFETKFIFWFLVGLIVFLGQKPDDAEQVARPRSLLT